VEKYSRNLWKTSGKFLLRGSLGRCPLSEVFPKYLSTGNVMGAEVAAGGSFARGLAGAAASGCSG
jgi:hypothetical protein